MATFSSGRVLNIGILLIVLLGAGGSCEPLWSSLPPPDLEESDLVGTWRTDHYDGLARDTFIIRSDGTFKQVYKTYNVVPWRQRLPYVYETPWNPWYLERRESGDIWLHLQGARHFGAGITFSENPSIIIDPFNRIGVQMKDELILIVRRGRFGALMLVFMATQQDDTLSYLTRISEAE